MRCAGWAATSRTRYPPKPKPQPPKTKRKPLMIPLAPLMIDRIAQRPAGDAASPQQDAQALNDRLRASSMRTGEKHAPGYLNAMQLAILKMTLEQFKQQVLMPDSDDP